MIAESTVALFAVALWLVAQMTPRDRDPHVFNKAEVEEEALDRFLENHQRRRG